MKHSRFAGVLAACTVLVPLTVFATGLFPDVPDQYPFKGEIESLARANILKGDPSGKFRPEDSVNRAEFLKMLYAATGRQPKTIYAACFTDVVRNSWYENYVCDAASKDHGFVQGYGDTFKPGNPVSRTEAIKMAFMLFGLNAPDINEADRQLIKFVDISTAAWYSKYIAAAYINGMLPITGQSGTRFYPDRALTRGEAAAYLVNAQRALDRQHEQDQAAMIKSSASSSASSVSMDVIKQVKFPFNDSDLFLTKRPVSYQFTITNKTVLDLRVLVSGYFATDVSCRLYLLGSDGFSSEYYLGFQNGKTCEVLVNARPGNYQFQIQSSKENVPYTVSGLTGITDGNDGFVDAISLKINTPKTAILDPNDLFDWYSFSVDKEREATIEVSASEKTECIVYTPLAIDQYGFVGPECGKPYMFQPGGSYIFGVGRLSGDSIHKIPYTVKWR
jgi:hypothetical protein